MEAQASGIPVVSTRHSGIPELVLDGTSGWLTDEGDADGLAIAVERLRGIRSRPNDSRRPDARRSGGSSIVTPRPDDSQPTSRRSSALLEIVAQRAPRARCVLADGRS